MQSHIHDFLFDVNYQFDKDNIFLARNNDFYIPVPPPGDYFMITEGGDFMITEDGNFMITE